MSVQRSPPTSTLKQDVPSLQYHSDTALNIPSRSESEDNYFNITKRQKRTLEEQPTSTLSEIKNMFSEILIKQDQKFELINASLAAILTQNQVIQESFTAITSQHQDLLAKVENLGKDNLEYKNRIIELEKQLDLYEKNSRCTTIQLRNIPKQEAENKQTLASIIQNIGDTVGLETQILKTEIRDIYRAKSEAIVVDFTTSFMKESVISKTLAYNKIRRERNEPLLNTFQIKLPGEIRPLYISEYLTSKTRNLFYLARQLVKNKKLAASWSSYGKIYVKKEETSKPVRVGSENELNGLFM